MAHFAKLDDTNTVMEIICVSNEELLDENGNESEAKGLEFLINWSGGYTNWKQTSYNKNFRINYAVVGGTYDSIKNAFIPIKPFASWVLVDETCQWKPPIPYPENTNLAYDWNEETLSWVLAPLDNSSYAIDEGGRQVNDMPTTIIGNSNA